MKVLRMIAAVVVGYVLYALLSMRVVGVVMPREGVAIVIVGLFCLGLIGLVAGLMASRIAGENGRIAAYVLAGLVALATVANLAMQLGAEPVWYKIGTLVLTVPAVLLMGLRR